MLGVSSMRRPATTDPQVEILRRMEPWQRIAAARDLYWFAREIVKNREKRMHPDLAPKDLEDRVCRLFQKDPSMER